MDARFLEQRAAPADARHLVASYFGDIGREGQVELRGDVGQYLVAAVGAPADGSVPGAPRGPCGPRGRAKRPVELPRLRVAERLRERDRLLRELVGFDEDEDAHATPSFCITSTTAGAASGPWPRTSACLPCP